MLYLRLPFALTPCWDNCSAEKHGGDELLDEPVLVARLLTPELWSNRASNSIIKLSTASLL